MPSHNINLGNNLDYNFAVFEPTSRFWKPVVDNDILMNHFYGNHRMMAIIIG